jgi:putative DNA primase/helicase
MTGTLHDFTRNAAKNASNNGTGPTLPAPNSPIAVARDLVKARYNHPSGHPVLRHWRGGWWEWCGSRWQEVDTRAAKAQAYRFTELANYTDDAGKTKPWAPTRHKIGDLLEALQAIVHLPDYVDQPGWIDAPDDAPDGAIVATANGLLDVDRRILLDHDPRFWNQTAVPFDFELEAPPPERWLAFLAELWPEGEDSIEALQEWFGYVVSGRLDLHKILLLVGPTRAGKGVIARTLGAMIGSENVAGPTLSSLGSDFGLAPLLGKPLAVVSDARLNGRDSQIVVERLLSISGEDTITVNRKYRDQWTGKLPSRFFVISNELPRLGDASAAIANRFVALLLEQSFLGREDHGLEKELHRELPGILNWALDGLARLTAQDRFTRPKETEEAIIALQDLASPVSAFVRDRCVKGGQESVTVDELFKAWKLWCEDNGQKPSTKQTFGRDLHAVLPSLRQQRPRDGSDRHRIYTGVGLTAEALAGMAVGGGSV